MTAVRRLHGFTLLELLIGLILLSFILVLLFAGLRLGGRSWDAGEARIDGDSVRGVLTQFLRRQLEQAHPFYWQTDVERILAFWGEPDAVAFVAPLSMAGGREGLHLIRIESRREGEGVALYVRFAHVPEAGFDVLDSAPARLLAADLAAVEFAYYGIADGEEQPAWHTVWRQQQNRPKLIRLVLADARRGRWPELLITPRLANEAGATAHICILC